jgi:hypothetical protein
MVSLLKGKLLEVLKAAAPLIAVVCLLQVTLVHAPEELFLRFLVGTLLAVVGMMLLFTGIDIGIIPMGQFIGAELPKRGSLALIVAVSFALGFAVTVAEPDVLVLANQVGEVSRGSISSYALLYVSGFGVALLTAVAMIRIVLGWPMRRVLTIAYALVLALSFVAPSNFISLAFDAGSVTTGVLSAPMLVALAIGSSAVLAGRSAVTDGFGLLGLASIGPIIAILAMGTWFS